MDSNFYYGMGVGMAMGAALDRMAHPKKKHNKMVGKAMKVVSTLVEHAADMIGK